MDHRREAKIKSYGKTSQSQWLVTACCPYRGAIFWLKEFCFVLAEKLQDMKRLDNECLTRIINHHRCIDWLDTSLKPGLEYFHCTFPVSKHRNVSSRRNYAPFHHFFNQKSECTSIWNRRFFLPQFVAHNRGKAMFLSKVHRLGRIKALHLKLVFWDYGFSKEFVEILSWWILMIFTDVFSRVNLHGDPRRSQLSWTSIVPKGSTR